MDEAPPHEDQVFAKVKAAAKTSDAKIGEHDYSRVPAPDGVDGSTKIALLVGEGDIVQWRQQTDGIVARHDYGLWHD